MKQLFIFTVILLANIAMQAQMLPIALDTNMYTRSHRPRLYTPFNNELYFISQDIIDAGGGSIASHG